MPRRGLSRKEGFFSPVCSTISTCRRFLPCADTILSRIKSGPWSQMRTSFYGSKSQVNLYDFLHIFALI